MDYIVFRIPLQFSSKYLVLWCDWNHNNRENRLKW